jgi:hypothetical protein
MSSHSKLRQTSAWIVTAVGAMTVLLSGCYGTGNAGGHFGNSANLSSVVPLPTPKINPCPDCGHHIFPN